MTIESIARLRGNTYSQSLTQTGAAISPSYQQMMNEVANNAVAKHEAAMAALEIARNMSGVEVAASVANRITLSYWRAVAAVTSDYCMDPAENGGNFNPSKAELALNFWKALQIGSELPYKNAPGIELLDRQMVTVLAHLSTKGSALSAAISKIAANRMVPSQNGLAIISAMGALTATHGHAQLLRAVIQSLLTPHRQFFLPTCSMNSIIYKESLECPSNLAILYAQILAAGPGSAVPFPANCGELLAILAVETQTSACGPSDGAELTIAVHPGNPGAWDNVKYLLSVKYFIENANSCLYAGIIPDKTQTYTVTKDNGKISSGYCGFHYPIRDVNDAFLAMFMQQVYNTNTTPEGCGAPTYTTAATAFLTARHLYYGVSGNIGIAYKNALTLTISTNQSVKLTVSGKTLQAFQRTMPADVNVVTVFTQENMLTEPSPTTSAMAESDVLLDHMSGHIENLYADQLRNFNPRLTLAENKLPCTVTERMVHIIGDRNLIEKGEPVYLGIIRTANDDFHLVSLTRNRKPQAWIGNPRPWKAKRTTTCWIAAYDK